MKSTKGVVIALGRFQPPTYGHETMIDTVIEEASRNECEHAIYVSNAAVSEKNPLGPMMKRYYLSRLFPKANFVYDKGSNLFVVLKSLSDSGYKKVILVAGDDRVLKYKTEVNKYINHPNPKKAFLFERFKVINVGSREDTISSTMMRQYVKENDFYSFGDGLPINTSVNLALSIFNDIKKIEELK